MQRLRSRLTYANVISTLCLVLLVGGGTAYAAVEMVPKNSVGSKQIRKEAITPAKLSKASKETLTGSAGPQGPVGATGKEGPSGKDGAPGKEGPQGPGAVTIEDAATSSFRQIASFGGLALIDSCEPGNIDIALEATGNNLAYFGTQTSGTTLAGVHAEGVGTHNATSTTVLDIDLLARDPTVSTAWHRYDLHISTASCQLTGTVTPSTVG